MIARFAVAMVAAYVVFAASPAGAQQDCGGLLQPPCPEPTATPTPTPAPGPEQVKIRFRRNRSFGVYKGGEIASCRTAQAVRLSGRVTGSDNLSRELKTGRFELRITERQVGGAQKSDEIVVKRDGRFKSCDLDGVGGEFVAQTVPDSEFAGRSNPVRTAWLPEVSTDSDVVGRQLQASITAPIASGADRGTASRAYFYAGPEEGPLRRLQTKPLQRRGARLTAEFRVSLDELPSGGSVYTCFKGTVYEGSLKPYQSCGSRVRAD